MSIYIGETFTIRSSYTTDAGVPVNPTLPVNISVYLPPNQTITVTDVAMTLETPGEFIYDYTATVTGTHWYKITTADNTIKQGSFYVAEDFTITDLSQVPGEYQQLVDRLRDFLDDTVEQNDLEGIEESTDGELYQAIRDTFEEVNTGFEPVDIVYNEISEVPWPVLKIGAVIQVLLSKGIGSARNTLTYNDAGGITIKDKDKFGRYTVWFNTLIADFRRKAQALKRAKNINGGYGGVDSEYVDNWW